MLNNKGYILYDGLVSIILLTTTVLFFNKIFLINNTMNQKSITISKINNALLWGIDHNYQDTNYQNINLYNKNNQYCGQFKNEKVCIIK